MTSTKERTHSIDKSRLFNRIMYGAFVLLSAYYLIIGNDLSSAMANLGIGLIFDPFDQKITWQHRPLYQRAWLLIHVSLVFVLLAIILAERFA